MKKETTQAIERIKENFKSVPDNIAKEDFYRVVEALVMLFVDSEPRLLDPTIDPEMKGVMFFKAILSMGTEGVQAFKLKEFMPEDQIPFLVKVQKFYALEDIISRYAK